MSCLMSCDCRTERFIFHSDVSALVPCPPGGGRPEAAPELFPSPPLGRCQCQGAPSRQKAHGPSNLQRPDRALQHGLHMRPTGSTVSALKCCFPSVPSPTAQPSNGALTPRLGRKPHHTVANSVCVWPRTAGHGFPRRKERSGRTQLPGAPEPDGAEAVSVDRGLSGPQSQNQPLCPVFSQGWLLKTGSPPGKQMFSTTSTKWNNESGSGAPALRTDGGARLESSHGPRSHASTRRQAQPACCCLKKCNNKK